MATLGWLATVAYCATRRGLAPPVVVAEQSQATAAGLGLGMGEADVAGGHPTGIDLAPALLCSTATAVRGLDAWEPAILSSPWCPSLPDQPSVRPDAHSSALLMKKVEEGP